MSDENKSEGVRAARKSKSNAMRRLWYKLLATPYRSAITVTFVLGVMLFMKAVWPFVFVKFKFTTTLTAVTQSFSIRTPPDGTSVWALPPGKFSALAEGEHDGCETRGFELLCTSDTNLKLIVAGSADLQWQTTPDGSWTFVVSTVGDTDFRVSVATGGDEAVESDQFVAYRADNTALPIRHPFVATQATVGKDLHQTTAQPDSGYDFWQPALLSGDVQMIANNKPSLEKYEVLAARIDPGDVVRVSQGEPQEDSAVAAIWGLLSIRDASTSANAKGPPIDVILHTSERQLNVSRFGAPDGHIIKASYWSILRGWPTGQAAWIWFVSLVLVMSFALQLGQVFCDRKSDLE